jgi:phage baseplate assembly protein gpV
MQDVIPSHFSRTPVGINEAYSISNNFALRFGEVQEIVYPSDPRSASKTIIEYRVLVQHTENGVSITTIYENCIVENLFGGFADQLSFTLRADPSALKDSGGKKTAGQPGKGAKVILLCLNGQTNNAVIIGGLRDGSVDSDPKTDKEKGHNLYFAFNGVQFNIDKDGQLTLTVIGATDASGKSSNEALPSTIKVEKNGKITASTKAGKSSVVLEQNGKVTVNSESEVTVNTKKAKIKANHTVVDSKKIELGGEGIGNIPANGLVHGTHVDTLTGVPMWTLGGTSLTVFGKK